MIDAFTSPGGSSESIRIYLARELSQVAEADRFAGEGEERDMPSRWVPLSAARDLVLGGQLHSPLGVMGILAAAAVLLPAATSVQPRAVSAPWYRGLEPADLPGSRS